MSIIDQKLTHLKWKIKDYILFPKNNYCIVCGKKVHKWINKQIITDGLTKEWHLSEIERNKLNLRESSFCPYCRNSLRSRLLAKAIIESEAFNRNTNLKEWVKEKNQKKDFKVAEINSCGNLHPFLAQLKNLAFSEYPNEDIMHLSYPDNSFDLVLHSEVLEHVQDPEKALNECKRILKKNSICLFTIPLIPGRKTINRVKLDNKSNKLINLKSPSYHGSDNREDYLVWWEFGDDCVNKFNLKTYCYNKTAFTYVLGFRKTNE